MLRIDPEALRNRSLFVGTPMYDGRCHSEFAFSIAKLGAICEQFQIKLTLYFPCHEALITKARNITVDEFVRSEDEHLMFIDSDIGFDPMSVIELLALQNNKRASYDVIAAGYPLKRISWEYILRAAKAGVADTDPNILARFASPVALAPVGDAPFRSDCPVEVLQAGTGFMMIRRNTFDTFRNNFEWKSYVPERVGLEATASARIFAYFDTEIDSKYYNLLTEIKNIIAASPDIDVSQIVDMIENVSVNGTYTEKYVSEDYAFCRRVRSLGMRVWICPWINLSHTGAHRFTGSLAKSSAPY
jgi:hypothetical protein